MNREFKQLMEEQWEGRLTAAGRARLDAMAAADPALARRLAEEERLTGMLVGCGPNTAPRDLKAGVFARLAEPEEAVAAQPAAVEAGEPRRSFWSLFQIPAVRWGMGFAVVMFMLAEIFVLFQMNTDSEQGTVAGPQVATSTAERDTQIASAPPQNVETHEDAAAPRQEAIAAAPAVEPDVRVAMNPATGDQDSAAEKTQTEPASPARERATNDTPDGKAAVPVPTSAPSPPPSTRDIETAAAKPVPTPGPQPAPSIKETLLAAAEPVKTPEPAPAPAPSTAVAEEPVAAEPVPTPAPTPKPELREIRVALQVVLPDASQAASSGMGMPAGGAPGGQTFRSQGGGMRIPTADGTRIWRNGLAPAAPEYAPDAAMEMPLPTRKDVEIALAGVGAKFEAEPANDTATLWRIRTTLSEHQLGDFLHALRQQNFLVAETPEGQPTPTPNIDSKGKGLGRFQNLQGAGLTVERKGAAGGSEHLTPVIPREDVAPGQYAVLEGEPLVRELSAVEETGPVKLNNLSPKPRTVQLTLLIQEPGQ